MVKLITPIGMLVTVALLAVYAVYSFWTAYTDQSWPYALLGLLTLVACIGTALLRAWSQYLVYALTAFFIGGWLYSVYAGAAVGFFSIFFGSPGCRGEVACTGSRTRRPFIHGQLDRLQALQAAQIARCELL